MSRFFKSSYYTVALLASMLLLTQCGGQGEDYKQEEDAVATSSNGTDSSSTGSNYPPDKVLEETNIDDEDDAPLEIGEVTSVLEKRKLLASLMRQKTDMAHRIQELKNLPGDASDNTVIQGDIDKLRTYINKLDQEIVDVRKAEAGSIEEVSESALAAIKGAGALMQSSVMRIDRGF